MTEDNMVLQKKELTDLTLLAANIIYDLYYTQCYVSINKTRREEEQRRAFSQEEADDLFQKTEELLRQFSNTSTEAEKIMKVYNKILKENKGLLLTESNMSDIIKLIIANCDHPLDIGDCIIHFNSFVDEDTEEMQDNLNKIIEQFDQVYMEHKLSDFLVLCTEAMPLIKRYVINELEVCDLLKPLGTIEDEKVYYINVESKPTAPLGYSSEFSYPLIPYRMIGYIDDEGRIKAESTGTEMHIAVTIQEMNLYKFDSESEEYVDVLIQLRNNNYLNSFGKEDIIISKGIRLVFKDYLKLYMTEDVPSFLMFMISLLGGD